MHSKGVHIPQPIHSKLSRLCPESCRPNSPAGALAGRTDQPRYRSERDPAARPDATRPRKGQRGPNAGNRGAPGRREGAPRNRGPCDRQRGRRARETPGNVWDANSVCGTNVFPETVRRPADQRPSRRERPSRPGARSIAPGDKGAEGGAGGRPGATRGWGGPTQATEPERPGGACPAPSPAGHVPALGAGQAVTGPERTGGTVTLPNKL